MITKYQETRASLENVERILAQEPAPANPGGAVPDGIESLEFSGVTYRHPGAREPALDGGLLRRALGGERRLCRPVGRGQEHADQAAARPVPARRGADPLQRGGLRRGELRPPAHAGGVRAPVHRALRGHHPRQPDVRPPGGHGRGVHRQPGGGAAARASWSAAAAGPGHAHRRGRPEALRRREAAAGHRARAAAKARPPDLRRGDQLPGHGDGEGDHPHHRRHHPHPAQLRDAPDRPPPVHGRARGQDRRPEKGTGRRAGLAPGAAETQGPVLHAVEAAGTGEGRELPRPSARPQRAEGRRRSVDAEDRPAPGHHHAAQRTDARGSVSRHARGLSLRRGPRAGGAGADGRPAAGQGGRDLRAQRDHGQPRGPALLGRAGRGDHPRGECAYPLLGNRRCCRRGRPHAAGSTGPRGRARRPGHRERRSVPTTSTTPGPAHLPGEHPLSLRRDRRRAGQAGRGEGRGGASGASPCTSTAPGFSTRPWRWA